MSLALALVAALSFCAVFYRVGEEEEGAGVLWGGLSLVLSLVATITLGGGFGMMLVAQLALMLGIAAYRLWRDPD